MCDLCWRRLCLFTVCPFDKIFPTTTRCQACAGEVTAPGWAGRALTDSAVIRFLDCAFGEAEIIAAQAARAGEPTSDETLLQVFRRLAELNLKLVHFLIRKFPHAYGYLVRAPERER